MGNLNGCEFPEELRSYVERAQWLWIRAEGMVVRVGVTDPAQTRAGRILVVRVKPAGTFRERGRPIASIESGKWAGPVMAPVSGELLEANPELEKDPSVINSDPYGKGWVARMRPSHAEQLNDLLSAATAQERFRGILEREGIHCHRLAPRNP